MKRQNYRLIVLLRLTLLMLLWPASTVFAVEVREYPVPLTNSGIHRMTTGPDGNLWFTEKGTKKIFRISPAGTITEFSLPEVSGSIDLIAVGADGNVWFSLSTTNADRLGQLSTDGTFKFFDVPMTTGGPVGILSMTAVRDDTAIYFSAVGKGFRGCLSDGRIYKIVPDGTMTVMGIAGATNLVLSQGRFWVSSFICDDLQPIAVTISSEGKNLGTFADVYNLIATTDGKVWAFVKSKDDNLAILQPEFPENKISFPKFVTLRSLIGGADRDIWFIANNSIIRSGFDGRTDEYELGLGEPISLASGADKDIWFSTTRAIYRLIPDEPGNLVIARSASYVRGAMATNSLVTIFGNALTNSRQIANMLPLPFELAGVKVIFTDSNGADHTAPLLFASPSQINCLVPANAQTGGATVKVVKSSGETVSTGKTIIDLLSPSLFTANASGKGIAAAVALRVKPDGTRAFEIVSANNPIDLMAGGQVFLVLFGSGMGEQTDLNKVNVLTSAGRLTASFVGAQSLFAGLNQVNILLPERLAGSGTLDLALSIRGTFSDRFTNIVKVPIK